MSIDLITMWHQRARPNPSDADFNVQLGCHFEEIVEMLETLTFRHADPYTGRVGDSYSILEANAPNVMLTVLSDLAGQLKAGQVLAETTDRKALLDSLADQVVTAVGVGHCAKMDTTEAVRRVNQSNWSKFDTDGRPIFDANGKVTKGPGYKPVDLTGLY